MSDQRICRCLERNFSCYPSYSKASLVSSSFLSLLHIFQSSTHNFLWENTLMKKLRNSCRKIKLSWHGATVLNIPEGHTCQMHLIMFGFVYNMCMCSYIAIISIWFPCLNNLHVLNVDSFCNLNQYLNLSEKWQKEAIKSYFRVGQIQNLNFSIHYILACINYYICFQTRNIQTKNTKVTQTSWPLFGSFFTKGKYDFVENCRYQEELENTAAIVMGLCTHHRSYCSTQQQTLEHYTVHGKYLPKNVPEFSFFTSFQNFFLYFQCNCCLKFSAQKSSYFASKDPDFLFFSSDLEL